MSEELKLPLNIEKALLSHLKKSAPRLSLSDLKVYFGVAFKSLFAKLVILGSLVSIVGFVLGSIFGDLVPESTRKILLYIFIGILLFLLLLVFYRATSGLLSLSKGLIRENSEFRLNERRYLAQRDGFLSSRKTYKALFESSAVLFGIAFDIYRTKIQINEHCAAEINNEILINATRTGMTSIERYTHTSYNVFSEEEELLLPDKEYIYDGNKLVSLTPLVISEKEDKIEWILMANPEFPRNIPIPYDYKTIITKQVFSMTTQELDDTNQEFEYYTHRVTYPTKNLFFEIIFPESYKPQNTDLAVWNTEHLKLMNQVEYQRLKKNPSCWSVVREDDIRKLILQIEYPITGIHYSITWVPMIEWSPVHND